MMLLALILAFAATPEWAKHALRLSGESDAVRAQSIQRLRALPDIQKTLLTEVEGPQRHLALDALTALELHDAVPELIRLSETDHDGVIYLAINALATKDHLPVLVDIYQRRLPRAGGPAKVVLLDTLGRMGAKVPEKTLRRMMASALPEVRSAVLYYARLMAVRKNDTSYVVLLGEAVQGQPYQLRAQAWAALSELKGGAAGPWLTHCASEKNAEVKALCARIPAK